MFVTNEAFVCVRYGKVKFIQMLPWMTNTSMTAPAKDLNVNIRMSSTKVIVRTFMSIESPLNVSRSSRALVTLPMTRHSPSP